MLRFLLCWLFAACVLLASGVGMYGAGHLSPWGDEDGDGGTAPVVVPGFVHAYAVRDADIRTGITLSAPDGVPIGNLSEWHFLSVEDGRASWMQVSVVRQPTADELAVLNRLWQALVPATRIYVTDGWLGVEDTGPREMGVRAATESMEGAR